MIKYGKRYFLHRLAGLVTFSAANFALARVTPRQSLGPFYPSTLPLESDSDLTFVEGKKGRASGHVTNLYGRLYSVDGSFLPQANIEIRQMHHIARFRYSLEARSFHLRYIIGHKD